MGSAVNISYGSLNDASREAKDVARKLDAYANSIEWSVQKKLTNYRGDHTWNISNASSHAQTKATELRKRADAYEKYATDLTELKKKCEDTDKAIKSKISNITATFKAVNGIHNNVFETAFNWVSTKLVNSTSMGRWLNRNVGDNLSMGNQALKQTIKAWWNYEGGKEVVKGVAIATLEIVGAVAAVVAAVVTGGAAIFVIAAVVGGIIAGINGVVNLVNEFRAYKEANKNGDPALAARKRGIDSIQTQIRTDVKERNTDTMVDENGVTRLNRENDMNAGFWNGVALTIDVVKVACDVIGFVKMGKELVKLPKNIYKAATGTWTDPKNLRLKDIISRTGHNAKASLSNGLASYKNGTLFKEIGAGIKSLDIGTFKEFGIDAATDFAYSMRDNYASFHNIEKGAKSIKNITGLAKTVISADSLGKGSLDALKTIAFNNINLGTYTTYDASKGGGALSFDVSHLHIATVTDAYDKVTSIKDGWEGAKSQHTKLLDGTSKLSSDLIQKLSVNTKVSVSVPDIKIPKVNYVKAA